MSIRVVSLTSSTPQFGQLPRCSTCSVAVVACMIVLTLLAFSVEAFKPKLSHDSNGASCTSVEQMIVSSGSNRNDVSLPIVNTLGMLRNKMRDERRVASVAIGVILSSGNNRHDAFLPCVSTLTKCCRSLVGAV